MTFGIAPQRGMVHASMFHTSPKEVVTQKEVEDKRTNLTTYNGPKQNWIFWHPTANNIS